MATLTVIHPVPTPPPDTYNLELTEKEARYLASLLGRCYTRFGKQGHDEHGSIFEALYDAELGQKPSHSEATSTEPFAD